jgi:hypothetical protein
MRDRFQHLALSSFFSGFQLSFPDYLYFRRDPLSSYVFQCCLLCSTLFSVVAIIGRTVIIPQVKTTEMLFNLIFTSLSQAHATLLDGDIKPLGIEWMIFSVSRWASPTSKLLQTNDTFSMEVKQVSIRLNDCRSTVKIRPIVVYFQNSISRAFVGITRDLVQNHRKL